MIRKAYSLSLNEYAVLCEISYLSHNVKFNGWCIKSKENIAKTLDLGRTSVFAAIQKLILIGLVEKNNDTTFLRTTDKWNLILSERENYAFSIETPSESLQSMGSLHTTQEQHSDSEPTVQNLNDPRSESERDTVQNLNASNTYKDKHINNISLDILTTSENEEVVKVEREDKRDPKINEMLDTLKIHIGIDAFADSSIERNIGKHLVNLLVKLGPQEFRRRLDIILNDSFKRKNCNRIRYIYAELKSFLPQQQSGPTVIR